MSLGLRDVACLRRVVADAGERDIGAPGVSHKDAKTELQEFLQARRAPLPRYELAAATDGPGQQCFRVLCHVRGLAEPVEAEAGTKRAAEQRAAREALQRLRRTEVQS